MGRRKRRQRRVQLGAIRVRAYPVLVRAVEEGIACGLRRARKHYDAPSDESIAEHVEREVLAAVAEVFVFDEEQSG